MVVRSFVSLAYHDCPETSMPFHWPYACFVDAPRCGGAQEADVLCPCERAEQRLDEARRKKGSRLVFEERFELFDKIISDMAKGNKLNLIFTDGKYLYAHTNCRGTMRYLEKDGAALISTQPLSDENWQLVPFGQLLAFNKGKLIKTGTEHHHEYIQSEEEMKLIYQIFANL